MLYALVGHPTTVREQRRANALTLAITYAGVLAACAAIGLIALQSVPRPFALPLTMLLLASVVVAIKPIIGIYLIGFFTLFTDASISPWWPFVKNMSSRESVLYMTDGVIITPMEVILVITAVVWVLRLLLDRGSRALVRGDLFGPVLVFAAFLFAGFGFGLVTGGDRYVAIWEFRPFLYLPLTYILLTNLFTTRRQYHRLAMVMLVAVVAHAVLALLKWSGLSGDSREELESLVDHGSAVQMSVVLMVAIAAWMLPQAPRAVRFLMPLAAVPVGWAWLISERRAAVVGLAVSIIFLGVLLFRLNRRRLYVAGPVFVLLTVGYLGAFWQSESTIGFPAQAIKTVVAPDEISEKDESSNLYRQIENFDIMATIHAKPITGFGFGQKFLRPVALANVSNFPFFEFIPHNSVLWIWIKSGVGGFVAMLFLFGSAIRSGVGSLLRSSSGRDRVLLFAAAGYVIAYLIFAYVDIAWDARSMVSVGVAMAVCTELVRLPARASEDETLAIKRASPIVDGVR
jgi:hypothetical protein